MYSDEKNQFTTQSIPRASMCAFVRSWLLMLPMVFLVIHGQPSFMQGSRNVEGGTGLVSATESSTDAADSSFERVFVYAAYGVVLAACILSGKRMRIVLTFAAPLLVLAGLALCSVLWSQVPINSLRSALYYTFDTLFALYLLATYSLEEIMSLVMMTGVLIAIFSVFTVAVFPQYGIVHLADHAGVWQGIFPEKNDAAKNLMFLLTPVFSGYFLQWKKLIYAALLLPLIVMTGSKSALVSIVIMIGFGLLRSGFSRLSRRTANFATAVIVVLSALFATMLLVARSQITALLGRDITLTGRTDIWQLLVESAMRRPWLGYGYSGFWTGMEGESGRVYETLHWIFTYAHNGLLEVWLQLGLVGVAIVLYLLFQAIRHAWVVGKGRQSPGTQWLVSLLVLTVVYNLDEGTILFTRSFVSMLFVLTCTGLAQAAKVQSARSIRTYVALSLSRAEQMAHA